MTNVGNIRRQETRTEARRRVVQIEMRNGTERAEMTNWVSKNLRWGKWKAPVEIPE